MTKFDNKIIWNALVIRTVLLSALLFWVGTGPALAAPINGSGGWKPTPGTMLFVDVNTNMGYLLSNGRYLPFLVATGQLRTVHYIGKKYFARTPVASWEVRETDKQPFGKTKLFLRLSHNGESTNYGIHSYWNVNKWLQEDYRYKSMGCIVVSEEMLELIHEIYVLNGNYLKVVTSNGPDAFLQELAMRELQRGI